MKNMIAVYVHFVWATWDRLPIVTEEVERQLYRYIEKICDEHECDVLAIGGVEDHVHLLVRLASKLSMADLMEYVKGGSSRFVSEEAKPGEWFQWQRGYGAFSVSPSHKKRVLEYVQNQKQHHRDKSIWEHAERIHIDEKLGHAVVRDASAKAGARPQAP